MIKDNSKHLSFYLNIGFVLASILIIIDFSFSKQIVSEMVLSIEENREDYYNASGNYHSSYKLITKQHQFPISEAFAASLHENQHITYAISPIFNEVNWSRSAPSQDKSFFSLRVMSGLVLPLMALAVLLFSMFKETPSILVFILKVLLVGDLIFLILKLH